MTGTAATPAPRLAVTATIYPLFEFTREVAGSRAEVTLLIPPGTEPHDWDPSPRDIARLHRTRLLVYNGAGLEPWVERFRRDLTAGGTRLVHASGSIPLLARGAEGAGRPAPAGGAADPHVWLDPLQAEIQVATIAAALAETDPAGAEAYAEGARAYADRLRALHLAFQGGLARCTSRDVVTSHAAFGYLARRYGLTQIAIRGLAPEMDPSPSDLADLARLARERHVRYVFFETLVSPKLADTLAREIGARTLLLNPIEGLTRVEAAAGKSYLSLMADNLRNLRTALACR